MMNAQHWQKSKIPGVCVSNAGIPTENWYTDPQTDVDRIKFLVYTRQHRIENAKQSKKDFIKFVKFYNLNRAALAFDAKQTEALKNLHAMWKQVDEETEMDFFYKMKEQHAFLNGKLMGHPPHFQRCEAWMEYLIKFQTWRNRALLNFYRLMKLCGVDMKPTDSKGA